MQNIRLSVMEFGRFTEAARRPAVPASFPRRANRAYSHYAPPARCRVPHPCYALGCPTLVARFLRDRVGTQKSGAGLVIPRRTTSSPASGAQSTRGFTIAVSLGSFHNPANSGSAYTFASSA